MDAQFKDLFKVTGKTKKAQVKEQDIKSKDDAFLDAMASIPEELKDSAFVTAYVKRRIIQRTKRASAKDEREKAQAAINKMKQISDAPNKVLLGAFRSKDFVYNIWELKNGTYYKEVLARPGLSLSI
jgi:spore cortex formation protein SpoVR/YcgB (stage V sporulation)